jgi:hypothetical protein
MGWNDALAEVRVDWDLPEAPDLDRMTALLERMDRKIGSVTVSKSPSGAGWHMRLRIVPRPESPMEVVALQAILGSDPWRECMQFLRARMFESCPDHMQEHWNVLYRPDKARTRHLRLK